MERRVKYAIMQYVPNSERDERINVAVTLHSPEDNYLETVIISNWRRLAEFDDELDIKFMKVYLNSIKEQFEINLSADANIQKDISNIYLLDNLTRFYINQFVFKMNELDIVDSCDIFLEKLRQNFLYYDDDKTHRVSKKDSKKFFEELLRGKSIQYEKKNLIGNYQEKINIDYKIGEEYYKFISFDETNVDSYIPIIKMWMLNSHEMKKINVNLVFVVNDLINNEQTSKLVKMLSDYGKVIGTSEIGDYFKK